MLTKRRKEEDSGEPQDNLVDRFFRKPIVLKKSRFPGVGQHIDVYRIDWSGKGTYLESIYGTEPELDTAISQAEDDYQRMLKNAMVFEWTTGLFVRNLFGKNPPEIKRAAKQFTNVNKILTQSPYGYGNEEGISYRGLIEELERLVTNSSGKVQLSGFRSSLEFVYDNQARLTMGMTSTSHPKVKELFTTFLFVLGIDGDKLVLSECENWSRELKNWEGFYAKTFGSS